MGKTLLFLLASYAGMAAGLALDDKGLKLNDQEVENALKGYTAALVITELPGGKTYRFNPGLCKEELSPCSTFKIVNALCALENGIVDSEDSLLPWDHKTRSTMVWNQDLTLKQAMAVSAVPHFQQLAERAGSPSMQKMVDLCGYGNRDISGGITRFWLGSSLLISADGQVEFLCRLVGGKLPIAGRSYAVLRKIILQKVSPQGTLYAKTGSQADAAGKFILGWYVGWVEEENGKVYVFALNLRGGTRPSGPVARDIVIPMLERLKLL